MGSVSFPGPSFWGAHRIWRRHGLDDDAGFGRALAGVAGGAAHRRHPGHVAPLALGTADRRTQSFLAFKSTTWTQPYQLAPKCRLITSGNQMPLSLQVNLLPPESLRLR